MTSTAYTDLFFAKYNQSGTVLMGRHLATSEARNMSLDYLNNIYIGGNFPTTSTIDFDPSTTGTFKRKQHNHFYCKIWCFYPY